MCHQVGFENGINKRYILDTRPDNFSGWRARPQGHSSISPCFPYSPFLLPCKLILLPLPWRTKLLWCGWRVGSPLHSTPERPCRIMWYTQTMNSVLTFVVWIQYLAQSYCFSAVFLLSPALLLGRSYWNQWTTLWSEEPFFGVCKTALVETTEMSSKPYL